MLEEKNNVLASGDFLGEQGERIGGKSFPHVELGIIIISFEHFGYEKTWM